MKMHKKLFGLLATAAVGLTLTSCGGGGGGGGGATTDDNSTSEEVPVYGAPVSLVGKTLTFSVGTTAKKTRYEFTFDTSGSFTGSIYVNGEKLFSIVDASYAYDRDSDEVAYVRNVEIREVVDLNYEDDYGDTQFEKGYKDFPLRFDPTTGRLLSAADEAQCSLY